MATKHKGFSKMTNETNAPEADKADAVVEQAAPAVTAEPTVTAEPEVTQPPVTQPPVTTAPVKSGTIVEKASSPAGKEASPQAKAAITAQTTAVPDPIQDPFEKKLAKVMETGSGREKTVVTAMRSYLDQMKPGKPVSEADGAKNQASLFRLFLTITRHDDQFKECMDLFISFFKEHKDGALHERYAFRFMEYMTISSEQINAFTAMVNLMKIAATVGKKEVGKHVDLNRTMNEAYSEDQRQRVISYFN